MRRLTNRAPRNRWAAGTARQAGRGTARQAGGGTARRAGTAGAEEVSIEFGTNAAPTLRRLTNRAPPRNRGAAGTARQAGTAGAEEVSIEFGTNAAPNLQQQQQQQQGGLGQAAYQSITLDTVDKEGTFVPGRRNKSKTKSVQKTGKKIEKKNSHGSGPVDLKF